eukprot:753972-Hanusia_phi.AAC.5
MVRNVDDSELSCSQTLEVGRLAGPLVEEEMLGELKARRVTAPPAGDRRTSILSLSLFGASVLRSLRECDLSWRRSNFPRPPQPLCEERDSFLRVERLQVLEADLSGTSSDQVRCSSYSNDLESQSIADVNVPMFQRVHVNLQR